MSQLGDSEIEHFNDSVRSNNHIVGLDVAMNYSTSMRGSQSAGDLDGNVNRSIQLHPADGHFVAKS